MKMLEFTLASGGEIDLQPTSITLFEEMNAGTNAHFPDARAFVRYSLGDIDYHAIVTETYSDLVRMLDINVRPGDWVRVSRPNGEKLAFLAGNVLSRSSATPDSEPGAASEILLTLTRNGETGRYGLKNTIAELRAMMAERAEVESAPEPIELPPLDCGE